MIFHSRYAFGDLLFCLTRANVDLPPVRCGACEGEKTVDVRGERFTCPKCTGKGQIVKQAAGWIVGDSGAVGQIRVFYGRADANTCTYDAWEEEPAEGQEYQRQEYMLSCTGVGSGTLWREHNLFASRKEAQAEADKRNDFVRRST